MTDHDDLGPDERRQARLLDGFLDDLPTGAAAPPPELDPGLSRIARLTYDFCAIPDQPAAQRATKAQTWEKLMKPASPSSVVTFPVSRLRAGFTPTGSRRGLAGSRWPVDREACASPRESSWSHRIGGRSLGLVATLTLVALVALSAFGVYLSAPPRDPPATIMAAGANGGTPGTNGGTPGTSDGGDVLLPNITTCRVEPRDYAQTMELIEPYLSGRSDAPEPYLDGKNVPPAKIVDGVPVPGRLELPPGTAPDHVITDQIASTWAIWQGCQRSHEYRRSASLFSDAGLVKYYVLGSNYYPPGSHVSNPGVDQLAREPLSNTDLPELDLPSTRAMTDLRLIGDDRAAAFISSGWTDPATPPVANDPQRRFGHIFFVRDGDRWLIDELMWWQPSAEG